VKVRQYQGDFYIRRAAPAGTNVSKGDVLLELDPEKVDTQIAAAANDAKIADVNLAKAESDVKLGRDADALAMSMAKDGLTDAQTDAKRWDETDGPAFMIAGGMQGKEADFTLESQQDELDQLKKMYESEDLTNETADIVMKRAERTVELYKLINKVAHAFTDRVTTFESTVHKQQVSQALDKQTQTVAQLEASQVQAQALRDTSLVSAKAAADEAHKKLDELKHDREVFAITSPIDGVVVYGSFAHKAWTETDPKKLAADEKITPDQVVMTVVAPKKLRVRAEWPEAQLESYSAGEKVKVTPTALPEISYDGTTEPMAIIGTGKGDAQVFDVVVDLLGSVDDRLSPGFKASVNLDGGRIDDALLVPASAVWRGKVWVRKPTPEGAAAKETPPNDEMRAVVVGRSDGRMVQIKSGLNEGELVLTQAKRPGAGG
jgi:multidrug efflux pump subunit AcrA (membrane-fusion protein)